MITLFAFATYLLLREHHLTVDLLGERLERLYISYNKY